jgi:hypothetical protein
MRSFSRFKYHLHETFLSDSISLKYTSLKKRYASPIGFSGLCSLGRVTFIVIDINQKTTCFTKMFVWALFFQNMGQRRMAVCKPFRTESMFSSPLPRPIVVSQISVHQGWAVILALCQVTCRGSFYLYRQIRDLLLISLLAACFQWI